MSFDALLIWQHFALMGAVAVLLQIIKKTLDAVGVKKTSKPVHILLPYLPMVLCAVAAWIPGVILAQVPEGTPEPTIGLKIVVGILLGGFVGQVWKAFKSKFEVLQGAV